MSDHPDAVPARRRCWDGGGRKSEEGAEEVRGALGSRLHLGDALDVGGGPRAARTG